jgi:hypothetical protein
MTRGTLAAAITVTEAVCLSLRPSGRGIERFELTKAPMTTCQRDVNTVFPGRTQGDRRLGRGFYGAKFRSFA